MAAPPMHYRVSLSGIFGTNTTAYEIWSMNLALGVKIPNVEGPNKAAMKTLANSTVTNWVATLMPRTQSVVRLTRVRVAQVMNTPDGRSAVRVLPDGSYNQADNDNGAAQPASVVAPTFPYQVSLALGLRSEAAGQVGRGRVYLPLPVGQMDLDGTLNDTATAATLGSFKDFITSLNLAADNNGFGKVVIASGGSVTRGIPAALYPVTRVEVGARPDIQRRRGNDVPEVRTTLAL